MARWLRPRTLAIGFGGYFVVIFLAAWMFSLTLTRPWYGPETTRWVFAVSAIASVNLIAALGMIAATRVSTRETVVTTRSVAKPHIAAPEGNPAPTEPEWPKDKLDSEIDHFLESLQAMGAAVTEEPGNVVEVVEPPAPDTLPAPPEDTPAASVITSSIFASNPRRPAAKFIYGPMAVSLVVLGISAALLPGAEGMLQSFHQLNTTLVLAFSYGWAGLGAYTAASVYGLLRE